MPTHRISLKKSESAGPFDIYYRLSGQLDFTLLLANVYDYSMTPGLCVDLPTNAVEMKMVNKHLGANSTIFKSIPQ